MALSCPQNGWDSKTSCRAKEVSLSEIMKSDCTYIKTESNQDKTIHCLRKHTSVVRLCAFLKKQGND